MAKRRSASLIWAVVLGVVGLLHGTALASSWQTMASPPVALDGSVSVLTVDGKILVSGGRNGNSTASSRLAFLFDPAKNMWVRVGDMNVARRDHAAVRLPSGKILVAGGWLDDTFTNAAEIFDPLSGTWRAVASMADRRYLHRMTALRDGRVLVTGGYAFTQPPPQRAQIFDEASETWLDAGFTRTRGRTAATLLGNGDVLLTGGDNGSDIAVPTAEIFSSSTRTWIQTSPMAYARQRHGSALLKDGRVLVTGGYYADQTWASAPSEIYDPATQQWSSSAGLAPASADFSLVVLDASRTLAIGGQAPATPPTYTSFVEERPVPDVWTFETSSQRWTGVTPLSDVRGRVNAIMSTTGALHVVGLDAVEQFRADLDASAGSVDPSWGTAGRSVALSPSPALPFGARAAASDRRAGTIVVATNCTGGACVARYDRRGSRDSAFGAQGLSQPISGSVLDVAVQSDGSVLVATSCGGLCISKLTSSGSSDTLFGNGGRMTADATSQWSSARIAVATNGQILVVGGCKQTAISGWCATKLFANGTADRQFASSGALRITQEALLGVTVNRVRVTTSGEVIAAAACSYKHSNPGYVVPEVFACLVKMTTGGQVLTTGADGLPPRLPFPGGYAAPVFVTYVDASILSDGSTVFAFNCTNDTSGNLTQQRLSLCVTKALSSGAIDSSYGANGYTILPGDARCSPASDRTVATGDERGAFIAVFPCSGGVGTDSRYTAYRAARLDTTGLIDSTFSGSIATDLVLDLAVSSDGGAVSVFGRWTSGPATSVVGYRLLPASPLSSMSLVEYRFAPLDYYFITARRSEQALLDGTSGWNRTGEVIPAYQTDAASRFPLTRYYFDRVAKSGTRGSHFYTALDAERALLDSQNPANTLAVAKPFNEGTDGYALEPITETSCPAGSQPVYRLFRGNNRFPDDPNHRFTTRRSIYDDFVARGWDGEGVKFCAPGIQ